MKNHFPRLRKISLIAFTATNLLASVAFAQVVNDSNTQEQRGVAPRLMDPSNPGFFQVGAGPSFGIGLGDDQVMYNLTGGYYYNLSSRVVGKVIGDLHLGSGTDSSRFIDFGVGADVYLNEMIPGYGVPYATADVGYGSARGAESRTSEGAAVGAGAGFKFQAQEMNFDVNLRYSVLTELLNNRNPATLGLRVAVNF